MKDRQVFNSILIIILSIISGLSISYNAILRKNNMEDKVGQSENAANDYQVFAENLKNQMTEKFDEYNFVVQRVHNDTMQSVNGSKSYFVILDDAQTLYVQYANDEKREVEKGVLNFFVIETGNGGLNTVYFIKTDGTVGSVCLENIDSDDDFEIEQNVDDLKDIVAIYSGTFDTQYSGAEGPIFVDINGNIYSKNLD